MPIQSVVFKRRYKENINDSKYKRWTIPSVIKWIFDHGYIINKIDITPTSYRVRQFDPIEGNKYNTIKLKNGINLIDSY